jgi:hypothetical protein
MGMLRPDGTIENFMFRTETSGTHGVTRVGQLVGKNTSKRLRASSWFGCLNDCFIKRRTVLLRSRLLSRVDVGSAGAGSGPARLQLYFFVFLSPPQCLLLSSLIRRPRVLTALRRTACRGSGPASSRRCGGPRVAVKAPHPHGVAADRGSR